MAHNIVEGLDAGILEGNEPTWHGLKEYRLVGDTPITADDVRKLVDYPIEVKPLFVIDANGQKQTSSKMVCRVLEDGSLYPLCRAVGNRYTVVPRMQIVNAIDTFLLQKFSTLRICGAGTLGAGNTFFMQLRVEDYNIRGDQSDHQLRLSLSDTYGECARVFCTHVRVVCQNTLNAATAEAAAANMLESIRHTSSAVQRIEANMETFAKIHLGLLDEIEILESLTEKQVDTKALDAFLNAMIPDPAEAEGHRLAAKRAVEGREKVKELFEKAGETMDQRIATSKYALLQSYTDYMDHHEYHRSAALRWQQGQYGLGAVQKRKALELLTA